MYKKPLFIVLVAVAALVVSFGAVAQDDVPVDVPTLESVTADPGAYFGQTVTLEGQILEYINSESFILGEGALLDDDRVLVINTSGQLLSPELFRGDWVFVTGIVHGSLDAWEVGDYILPGGIGVPVEEAPPVEEVPTAEPPPVEEATPEDEAPPEDMTATPEGDTTDDTMDDADVDTSTDEMAQTNHGTFMLYYNGRFPDDLRGYTIIEVTNVEEVVHQPETVEEDLDDLEDLDTQDDVDDLEEPGDELEPTPEG